jgi:hypothetical protein
MVPCDVAAAGAVKLVADPSPAPVDDAVYEDKLAAMLAAANADYEKRLEDKLDSMAASYAKNNKVDLDLATRKYEKELKGDRSYLQEKLDSIIVHGYLPLADNAWGRLNMLASKWKLRHHEVVEFAIFQVLEFSVPTREDVCNLCSFEPGDEILKLLEMKRHKEHFERCIAAVDVEINDLPV